MRRHALLPLLACWPLAAATTAHAAVPMVDGVLQPRTGAELVEAVTYATTPQPGIGDPKVTISLARGEYLVDRPLNLSSAAGDTLVGESTGDTTIRGTGAASTLVNVTGGSTVSNVSIEPAAAASSATYPLVKLAAGATLEQAYVSVPETRPNVTAVEAADATVSGVEIESLAAKAAVVGTGSLTLEGATSVSGGNPTVDLAATSTANSSFRRAFLTGGPQTATLLRLRTGAVAANLDLQDSILRSPERDDGTLIDLIGASAATGSVTLGVQRSTLSGGPDSTAVRVATGSETRRTAVTLGGLLSIGSSTAVDCRGGRASAAPSIAIDGIYRSGANQPGTACTIVERTLRTGGDPALTTERGLQFGSPAIDVLPAPPIPFDTFFGERSSRGPNTPAATPSDLGALEYQYAAPSLDELTIEPSGTAGLVRLSVIAGDPNEGETDRLVVVWRFPDGSTATGTEVTRAAFTGGVTVTATDPTGLAMTITSTASSQLGDEEAEIVTPEPTPTPTPTPEPDLTPSPTPAPGQQTLPETVTLPKPSSPSLTPLTTAPTATVRAVRRPSSRTGRSTTRPSGLGAARSGEAAVEVDLSRAANLTVIARRRVGTRLLAVPNARISIDVTPGVAKLHLSSRLGTTTLRPGLYRVTILVRPVSGAGERRDLYVRVIR